MIRSSCIRCHTRRNRYSGHSGSRMRDSRLRRRQMSDGLLPVQCILPYLPFPNPSFRIKGNTLNHVGLETGSVQSGSTPSRCRRMSLEPIGIFTLALGIYCLFAGTRASVVAFITLTVLGAAAAILIGSANIQPAHLFLAFLALGTLTFRKISPPRLRRCVSQTPHSGCSACWSMERLRAFSCHGSSPA